MTSINHRLVLDLAKLFNRYGPEDLQALGETLENEASRSRLIDLLKQLSETARSVRGGRKPRKHLHEPQSPSRVLSGLEKADPEKFQFLSQLRSALASRELPWDSGELRDFASSCGLELRRGLRREAAIGQLMRFFAETPLDEIRELLAKAAHHGKSGKDYERWVDMIFGKRGGGHMFQGPDGKKYNLEFMDVFTGVVGFLGITKTVANYIDVFVRVRISADSLNRVYSFQLMHMALGELAELGLFSKHPDGDDWERLCALIAPNYVFSQNGTLIDSDPHELVPIVIKEQDVESACRTLARAGQAM